jgi:hypothetical protein
VDLLTEAEHRVLGQRLEVLPAVEGAELPERGVVHLDVTTVALTEHGTLDVGGLELAADRDHVAAVADERLRHVQTAPGTLAEPEDHEDAVLGGGRGDPLHLGAVAGHRVLAVAGDELHPPGRGVQPDPPRVAGDEGLAEGDQLGPTRCRLADQVHHLLHAGIDVQPPGLGLHCCHSNVAHGCRLSKGNGLLVHPDPAVRS